MIYLLHINPPLLHSAHYVGYCGDGNGTLDKRLQRHRAGTGGMLPREAIKQGSTIEIAHVWPGAPREFERYVKRHGGAGRWRPVCGKGTRRIPSIEAFNKSQSQGDMTCEQNSNGWTTPSQPGT